MNNTKLGHGAIESKKSVSDIMVHQVVNMSITPAQEVSLPDYPLPHVNQNQLGICTAADIVDMAQAHFGIEFSMRFTYKGGKDKYDGNEDEGSSNLSMLSFAKNYGFLPASMDPEGNNTNVSYADFMNVTYTPEQYAAAAQYKISGYATVPLDPVAFATALSSSQYGLITRMSVGDNFYTPSWSKADLQLLRAPSPVTDGHSIKVVATSGLDVNQIRMMRNTWGGVGNPTLPDGTIWSDDGDLEYEYNTQQEYVTEAYAVFFGPFKFIHDFMLPIQYGDNSPEVAALQRVLGELGFFTLPAGVAYGYYGDVTTAAVLAFQQRKGIPSGDGRNVGKLTMAQLNLSQGL